MLAFERLQSSPRNQLTMLNSRAIVWNIDRDVLYAQERGDTKRYRTAITASNHQTPVGSIVFCSSYYFGSSFVIEAIGKVVHRQAVSTNRMRVRIEPIFLLTQPIGADPLGERIGSHLARTLDEMWMEEPIGPKRLTERATRELISAVRSISAEADYYLSQLAQEPPELDDLDKSRLVEERDAFTSALRVSALSRQVIASLAPAEGLERGAPFGLAISSDLLIDNEDDLIAADLRRFDEEAQLSELGGSVVRVTDRELKLTVMNVNRKPLEHVFGVDLVYYDHIANKAIAVQYKRLDRVKCFDPLGPDTELAYLKKSELLKQLALMRPHSTAAVASADELRFTTSPNFFKFVQQQEFDPDSRALLKGMYIPDEYLRLGIAEDKFNTGPRNGFRITYNNSKYLTSDIFIDLVRRCWIGTRATDRSSLIDYVARRAQQCEVVLALRDRNRPANQT